MNPEQRKLYNMAYYESNKPKIIEKACAKVVCQYCQRSIIKNNVARHQLSDICHRKQDELINNAKRLKELNDQINNTESRFVGLSSFFHTFFKS